MNAPLITIGILTSQCNPTRLQLVRDMAEELECSKCKRKIILSKPFTVSARKMAAKQNRPLVFMCLLCADLAATEQLQEVGELIHVHYNNQEVVTELHKREASLN